VLPRGAGARWLAPLLLANLVLQVLIVVTGGVVRVTGSGLGCPTWPECVDGSITPVTDQAEGIHKWIEFGNRTLTGLLAVVALASVLAVWRWAPRRALKVAAVAVLVGVVVQAVLGGITVLAGLHPVTVSAHFLVSAALIAAAAYLFFARTERDVPPVPMVPHAVTLLARATCVVGAVVLVLGTVVTGTGPHSGDAREPARYPFDARTVSWLHADVVMLFLGLVVAVWVAARVTGRTPAPGRAWAWVLGVSLAQGVVGYVQYFTDLPEALVITHLLGASLLVVALTYATMRLRQRV
jgi:cytochrome c oxidase assembly protein subunit 15